MIKYLNNKLSNAKTLIRYFPIVLKSAEGLYITDIDNKKYIDCISAAGGLPFGHNHPIIKKSINDFNNKNYPVQTMDIPTVLQYDFMKTLYDFLPIDDSHDMKIQMCSPSGGDVVDAAIKLAKISTGRNSILAFNGGYHGQTYASSSVSGKVRSRFSYNGLPDVHFLPYNHQISSGEYIEDLIKNPQSGISLPAGIIIEPIQGEGGVNIPSKDFLKELREVTLKYDIPLIVDEIQTGFCRTGKKFGFEHSEITPDIVCMAKAIGGSMPMGVLLHKEKFNKWEEYHHAGTFRGNQLAFLTGSNGIKYMEENKLWENAEKLGKQFVNYWENAQSDYSIIKNIRGVGVMLAIEVKSNSNNFSDTELAINIQKKCMEGGLLIMRGGAYGNVLRIMPPLITTNNDMNEIINILKNNLNFFN